MPYAFQENEKILRVLNAVAAGTTDQTSSAVDTAGWDSCEFVALFGTLTATQVTKLKAQQSSDDGVADDYTDLLGSLTPAMADADSNKMIRLEIVRPRKRYLKCVVDRGTANAVIDGVIAILRRADKLPITQHSTVSQNEAHNAPAEGTA